MRKLEAGDRRDCVRVRHDRKGAAPPVFVHRNEGSNLVHVAFAGQGTARAVSATGLMCARVRHDRKGAARAYFWGAAGSRKGREL